MIAASRWTVLLLTIVLVSSSFGPALAAGSAGEAPTSLPEPLETAILDQLMNLETTAGYAACFAPGTSPEYVAEVTRRANSLSEPLFQAGGGFDRHRLGNRWSTTATDGGGLGQGDPTTLTWSYVQDGTFIAGFAGEPGSNSALFAWLNGVYGDFNTWHALFIQIFDRWSALSGFSYAYEPNDDGLNLGGAVGALGVRGDLRIGAHIIDGNSGILAYNFFPNNGDMVIDAFDAFYNNTTNNSIRMRNVLAHEHGHGLGLNHVCPVSQSKLMEPFVSVAFDGPQFDDVLGTQRGYGDFNEHNDTSGTATALGVLPAAVSDISIDDGGGEDWFSVALGSGEMITATVTPSGVPYLEGPQNANGSCPAGTSFDPRTELDLRLEILGTDGSTVLASVNDTGLGGSETTSAIAGAAGTYYVRVFNGDAVDNAQAFMLDVDSSATLFGDGFESGDTSLWDVTVP